MANYSVIRPVFSPRPQLKERINNLSRGTHQHRLGVVKPAPLLEFYVMGDRVRPEAYLLGSVPGNSIISAVVSGISVATVKVNVIPAPAEHGFHTAQNTVSDIEIVISGSVCLTGRSNICAMW